MVRCCTICLPRCAHTSYARAGLDDNWQACHAGRNGSFHDKDGMPLINKTLFPDMAGMVAYGHKMGLKVGW